MGMMPRPVRIRTTKGAETERKVWDLRKAGGSFEQIGPAIGITPEGARRAYLRALNRWRPSPAEVEEERKLAHARLEELLVTVWGPAKGGDLAAVDSARRIILDIARLLGLMPSAPVVDISITQEEPIDDLRAAREAIGARLARVTAGELTAGDDPGANGNGHRGR